MNLQRNIRCMLEEFALLKENITFQKINRMNTLLGDYRESRSDFYKDSLDRFNVFRVLKIPNREISHSNFLAWLFNANAEQEEAFLRAFFSVCGINLAIAEGLGIAISSFSILCGHL